jgi:hypothetical protein
MELTALRQVVVDRLLVLENAAAHALCGRRRRASAWRERQEADRQQAVRIDVQRG